MAPKEKRLLDHELYAHWGYRLISSFQKQHLPLGYANYIDLNRVMQCLARQDRLSLRHHRYPRECWTDQADSIQEWLDLLDGNDWSVACRTQKIPPIGSLDEIVALTLMVTEGALPATAQRLWDEMQLGFLAVDGPTPKLWEGADWTSAQWMRDNVEITERRGIRVNFAVNLNQEFGRGGSKLGNYIPAPTTSARFSVIPSSSPSTDTESAETEQDHQLDIFVPEDDENDADFEDDADHDDEDEDDADFEDDADLDGDFEDDGDFDDEDEEREGEDEETYHENNPDSYRRRLRDRSTLQAARELRSDGHETSDRRRETQQTRSLRARNYGASSPPIDRSQNQDVPPSPPIDLVVSDIFPNGQPFLQHEQPRSSHAQRDDAFHQASRGCSSRPAEEIPSSRRAARVHSSKGRRDDRQDGRHGEEA